jgi:hypothetical protein
MNLGDFKTMVSSAIKRGSSLDAIIPLWISQAARLLEQNYTFSWMWRTTDESIPAGIEPLVLALDPLIKQVHWVKPKLVSTNTDGTEWYGEPLYGADELEVEGLSGGCPTGFWLLGTDGGYTLNFDAIPQMDFPFKMRRAKYTDWPTADDSTTTLLLRGEMAHFAQTLILFANQMRDANMASTYGGILQGALNTLLRSEEDLQHGHQAEQYMRPR